ncbi:amiloride-sensitive sodium channel subunit delta [Eublepharis macularius]|uniref:Amiloride-sensitive sodium channel subunit delta n=1 Tax=Eublepharis macularius TaxID=481883 RepID=A0AA97KIL2_EUBMA|nr:amiloride-sensitive sodium channel subunit delta [Eublepharis macularius]
MEREVVTEKEEMENKERKEALIEFYSSFKDLFEFFCLNTTIHGTVRLVCSSRNKMKTAFWALLFLASFAMLYWQFASLFNDYWNYPVIMKISVHSEPKLFPAITICDLNPARVSIIRKNMAELDNLTRETISRLYGSPISENALEDDLRSNDWLNNKSSQVSSSSFHLNNSFGLLKTGTGKVGFELCNKTGGECYNKVYLSGVDAFREWYRFHYMNIMSQVPKDNFSHHEQCPGSIQDFVYSCRYNQQPCSDSVCRYHAIYGSCFTYNSNGTEIKWQASKPGILYGLSLILKVEQKNHIPMLSTKAGAKVMIHNHNQSPFLEHEGFDIRPGIQSTVGMKQVDVTRLGGNYGDCTTDGKDVNVTSIYNSSYTLQACLHSCFQQLMIEKCGCGYYYYPLPRKTPKAEYCNYNKYPAWGHCFYRQYDEFASHQHNCFQKCRKPCRETWYRLSAGYAKWPSTKSEKWIHKVLKMQYNYSTTTERKDIAKVNIFYEHLDSYSLDETPGYDATLAMSNMGSQWSLWFGSSVLSVVEMLEFLVDVIILSLIFCYRWLTAKKLHVVTHPPAISTVSLTLEKYRYVEEGLATSQNVAKLYASEGDSSLDKNNVSTPYSKYGRYHVPEQYTGVVLNGFKYQDDHCSETGLSR